MSIKNATKAYLAELFPIDNSLHFCGILEEVSKKASGNVDWEFSFLHDPKDHSFGNLSLLVSGERARIVRNTEAAQLEILFSKRGISLIERPYDVLKHEVPADAYPQKDDWMRQPALDFGQQGDYCAHLVAIRSAVERVKSGEKSVQLYLPVLIK